MDQELDDFFDFSYWDTYGSKEGTADVLDDLQPRLEFEDWFLHNGLAGLLEDDTQAAAPLFGATFEFDAAALFSQDEPYQYPSFGFDLQSCDFSDSLMSFAWDIAPASEHNVTFPKLERSTGGSEHPDSKSQAQSGLLGNGIVSSPQPIFVLDVGLQSSPVGNLRLKDSNARRRPREESQNLSRSERTTVFHTRTGKTVTEPASKMFKVKHVPTDMCFHFPLTGAETAQQRSRVDARRVRQPEINRLRRMGACFQCRMLKLRVSLGSGTRRLCCANVAQCSGKDPCDQCVLAAATATTSKALRQSRLFGCIRDKLANGSPFARGIPYADVKQTVELIEAAAIKVDTAVSLPSPPDIIALANQISDGLEVLAYIPQVSVLGVMMDETSQQLLSTHLPGDIYRPFNLLLTATALLWAASHSLMIPNLEASALQSLRDWSGQELLRQLDKHLVAKRLGAQNLQSLSARYLVLLITIVAANSVTAGNPRESCVGGRTNSDRSALARTVSTLAHHMAYLGSKTTIKTERALKTLFEHAQCNFHLVHDGFPSGAVRYVDAFPSHRACVSNVYSDDQNSLQSCTHAGCGQTIRSREPFTLQKKLSAEFWDLCRRLHPRSPCAVSPTQRKSSPFEPAAYTISYKTPTRGRHAIEARSPGRFSIFVSCGVPHHMSRRDCYR